MAYIVKVNIIIYNEQTSLEYNIKKIFSFSAKINLFMTLFKTLSISTKFFIVSYILS